MDFTDDPDDIEATRALQRALLPIVDKVTGAGLAQMTAAERARHDFLHAALLALEAANARTVSHADGAAHGALNAIMAGRAILLDMPGVYDRP
jgi:hypothetical protein